LDGLAIIFAICATFSWGLTLLLMKVGVDRMDWVGFGMLRPWMALPFILVYAVLTGGFDFVSGRLTAFALASGVVNALFGTALYYYALSRVSMHEVNILANTNPFWGVVSAIVVLGEPAQLITIGAGVLVLGGTYFLVRRDRGAGRSHNLTGLLAALGAGMLWGFSSTVLSKICMDGGMSPITYQLLFTCSAAATWTLVALPRICRGRLRFGKKDLWVAFGSSLFGLFVGWVFWLTALQRVTASALSPLISLSLLFATILGAVVLKERVTRRIMIGGALVVAGVLLVAIFGS